MSPVRRPRPWATLFPRRNLALAILAPEKQVLERKAVDYRAFSVLWPHAYFLKWLAALLFVLHRIGEGCRIKLGSGRVNSLLEVGPRESSGRKKRA